MMVDLSAEEIRALANAAAEVLDGCEVNDPEYWPPMLAKALLSGADKLEALAGAESHADRSTEASGGL